MANAPDDSKIVKVERQPNRGNHEKKEEDTTRLIHALFTHVM